MLKLKYDSATFELVLSSSVEGFLKTEKLHSIPWFRSEENEEMIGYRKLRTIVLLLSLG